MPFMPRRVRVQAQRATRRPGIRAFLDFVLLLAAAFLVSEAALLAFYPLASAADREAVHPLSGAQPFATLLCKFADVDVEPLTPAYFDNLLGSDYPGLDDYWREVSYDQINLTGSKAGGWYTLPGTRLAYRQQNGPTAANLDRLAADCIAQADADFDFTQFTGINLVFNACIDRPRGGLVDLVLEGEKRRIGVTWLCPLLASAQNTVAHEMGHALGMQHSAAGHEQEYGNVWDIMSTAFACQFDPMYGSIAQHPAAFHKDLLGWIPPERKFVALPDTATQITLEQLARPPMARGTYLMAQIPIPGMEGGFYTVEARMRVGYDRSLPADSVVIHEVTPFAPTSPLRLVNHNRDADTDISASMWPVGSAFVDEQHGITVTVDQKLPSGFVVTIYTRPAPQFEEVKVPGLAEYIGSGPAEPTEESLRACLN